MNKKIVIGFAALSLATFAYFNFSTASVAQPPAAKESLEEKVVRLEKEVSELRKEVARLKNVPQVTTIPAIRYQDLQNLQVGRAEPLPGTPFTFNGQTYYQMLLNEKLDNTDGTVNARITATNPLVIPPK
ncbi:MAG: hypothetical protein H8F28_02370 [Fibrella sp.]|nr:hypothetical protein [Armatimonadota bacterium]